MALKRRKRREWAFTYRNPGSSELNLVKVKAWNFRDAWKYVTADGAIVVGWRGISHIESQMIQVMVGEY